MIDKQKVMSYVKERAREEAIREVQADIDILTNELKTVKKTSKKNETMAYKKGYAQALFDEGYSVLDISIKLGYKCSTVRNLLKETQLTLF